MGELFGNREVELLLTDNKMNDCFEPGYTPNGEKIIGVDYGSERDETVLTVGIIKEAVDRLSQSRTFYVPFYFPVHPKMLHWFSYRSILGGTNSKRKFRHRNYEKAIRRKM